MKIPLLLFCLLFSSIAFAQDEHIDTTGSFAHARRDSLRMAKAMAHKKNIDLGGGVQVNNFRSLGTSTGLLFSLKANTQNGRIAGLFSVSYNLNNNFNVLSPLYYYNNYSQTYPPSKFQSGVRYNFLKLSAAVMVPFFNRTNKKGFSLAGIAGLSYCNGLGSGEYVSFMDKANPPVIDTVDIAFVRPSQKFSMNNHNFAYLGLELGLSASYTYERYQFFVDGNINLFDDVSEVFNNSLTVNSDSDVRGVKSPIISYTINAGVRYCLYYPWQSKPPKHKDK